MKQTNKNSFIASLLIILSAISFNNAYSNTLAEDQNKSIAVNFQKQTQTDSDFEALLKESGLSFQQPVGFHSVKTHPDYVLPYEMRVRNSDESLEIRYAIRPLKRIEIAYDDPHSSAPYPNDLFEMLFRTISETLAGNTYVRSRAYNAEQAREKYNAGWASVGVFDVSPDVSKKYKQGILIAIHHNDKADAYLLFLTNDLQKQKKTIQMTATSLKFIRFEKGINQPKIY